MKEQSKLAERILDQVADAVICADHSGTIIRWNHAAAALFGHSAEEALGPSVDLIIPEHLRAAHWSGFDAAMAKGATKLAGRPTLTRALHKSGRRLYVEMFFAIVKGDIERQNRLDMLRLRSCGLGPKRTSAERKSCTVGNP